MLFVTISSYSQEDVVFVRNYKDALYIANVEKEDSLFFHKLKEKNIWEKENYIKHNNYDYAETIIVADYEDVIAICEKYNLDKAEAIPILNYLLVTRFYNKE